MNKTKTYICPICGYNQLEYAPYDENGIGSFNICPCCMFEFGSYNETVNSYEVFFDMRKKWINSGKKWCYPYKKPPKDWDPDIQLKLLLQQNHNN